jgi:hypothetical protein
MSRCAVWLGLVAAAVCTESLAGQSPRTAVSQLFTFGTCGQPLCLDLQPDSITGINHGLHFIKATETSGGTVISFLTSAIGFSISNTPVTSSSSGTTFRFEGGAPVATSTSGGPIFGERAQTIGRGRWFVGVGLSQLQFERLNGVPLSGIVFNFTHQNVGDTTVGIPPLERDYIQMKLDMSVNLLVASFSSTYGVMDGVDLGVTVPFVRTSVSGHSSAEIFLIGQDTLHRFAGTGANPVLTATSTAAGIASGLGDVEGHLKIRVSQTQRLGIALYGSARFPTGDESNLLGAGSFSARGLGIVSARLGNFNPHAYAGYTVRTGDLQTNSVEGNVGFDNLLAPWATMAFDVLGSWQVGASKIGLPPPVQYTVPATYTLQVTNLPSRRDDFLSMSFGFKFRTRRGIQLVANALVPLKDSGLQPQTMLTGGLEYTF